MISVIIPSKTVSNLLPCVAAIRKHDPSVRVIAVDDGLELGSRECGADVVPGERPFIYARNCNIGIRAAGADDVILLNDDALLETPGGFTAMRDVWEKVRSVGIISATTNIAGNREQWPMDLGLRDAGDKTVAFVCVFIPRLTIDRVGLLDERFTAYGFDDDDYCRRVRDAGLLVGIFDGCYVDHGSLHSTFRGDPRAAGDISEGARIYHEKWGNQ